MDIWTILAERVSHWYKVRETVRELEGLDEHILDDLGIGRGDIHEIAVQSVNDDANRLPANKPFGYVRGAGYQAG